MRSMGVKAGNIYGLGIQLGFSSFFASAGDTDNAEIALANALNHANALAGQGIALKVDDLNAAKANPQHNIVETLREVYKYELGLGNKWYNEVYDFAVSVGIAEGQASADNPTAYAVARDSMKHAGEHEKNLLDLGYRLVPITDKHYVIEGLREAWQTQFSNSPDPIPVDPVHWPI
jgi:hypothetical protein